MSIFSFYAVLLIAHLVNFRSAGFIISSLFYSDQYTVARGLLPLHRSKHSRTSILSRGNQLCMLKEDSTVVTGGDDKDLSILSGRGRDRVSTYNAIKNLMRDPLFLQKSNSLKLISDALKRCGTPSDQMLYFWKKAVHHGVAVRKRDVKDMLYYCYDYGRRDTVTIKKALETVCSLDKAKYWNSLIMNLIIQIYTERIDGAYEINKSGILLRDIVRDVISTDEKIMDEKSLVMLLKYFSGMEDYKSLNLVFSSRKNATKRPLEGQLVDIDIEVRFTENVVVWNAYLTALMKLSAKGNDSLDNQFLAEANEMLKTMIDLKIADFYTMCIMLEFYAGKINANKKNTNTKKSEELVNKCLEVWNNAYFSNLIKSNQQYDKFDDIPRGLKISYATMIKCLLLSADLANGQEGKKTTNVDSNTISDGTEQKSKLIVDNYVNIALKLALEVPSDEVTSALLFSLGLAEENCEVAIKYMKILIEKSRSMSKYESKSESEIEKEGQSSAKTECEDTISSKSDTNDKTAVQKSTKNRTMKDSQNHGKLYCTNHIDSLLNGYYYSNRTDLVTEAYFLAHENLSKTTTNKNQFSTLKISKLNIEGSTKAFNIFLASLKLMVRSNTIEEKSKDQLWRFSRSVIKERVAAETRRLSAGLRDEKTDEKREERRGNGESKEMNRSDNETPSFFDSYTTIISMDLANMLSDYAMSRDLFYQHETTSPPSERAVQTYLRSFQAPSQLFELDKLVNVALEKSQRYKVMFSAYPDPKGDNTRTFDEIINAYLRVGNLPIALEYAAKYSNKFSDSAMKNLLIRFDRFWRDYDNQTVYLDDLLKGNK